MSLPGPLVCALLALALASGACAEPWRSTAEAQRLATDADLVHVRRTATRAGDGKEVTAHLALFPSRAFRLEVVDLGEGREPSDPGLPEALRAHGCVAGVNGGFFHGDWRPLGLVIAQGRRRNRLESIRLLSGVIYSDPRGITLVRRSQFRDHPDIQALLQGGPYLVEGGRAVRGLSPRDPDRRTFIATDWRGNWAIGATLSAVSLAELAQLLATPGALVPWKVDRALNLDGGSSTGFFFDRGEDQAPVHLRPWRRVRNLLGIAPR